MLNAQQVALYLERIAYGGSTQCDLTVLHALHRAHVQCIPFENLDIMLGQTISLVPENLFKKIVLQRRGGICYELNTLFCVLLRTLGFQAYLLAGQVFNGTDFGPPFDHMLLLIKFGPQQLIADVGFGDAFTEALTLHGPASLHNERHFLIEQSAHVYTLIRENMHAERQLLYRFRLNTYDVTSFSPMCDYHQTSAESHFTRRAICSLATEEGRKSIRHDHMIMTTNGHRTEYRIRNEDEYRQILCTHFQINFPQQKDLRKLLNTV